VALEGSAEMCAFSEQPLVSVLLPVYNGADYLNDSIQSILAQTYSHLELIVIDDGSTDESYSMVMSLHDERIRSYQQENMGLARTLNRAINLARGKYFARQDQDDISLPRRIEMQVDFLERHPSNGLVGTWASIMRETEKTNRVHCHPTDNIVLQFELLFDNPFVHSSMMIRRSILEEEGGYSIDVARQPPEDYELWSRMARRCEVANIPEVLQVYREVTTSMSRLGSMPFLNRVVTISAENLCWAAGSGSNSQAAVTLAALAHGAYHRIDTLPGVGRLALLLLNACDNISDRAGVNRRLLRRRAAARLRVIFRRYARLAVMRARQRLLG
jgi:glycosyltransferase involved in cell wall biosynthesis